MKSEVMALRGTNKGLGEENSLLKEFLNRKKNIILELNGRVEQS